MPMPCESWPLRLAITRFSATLRASSGLLPPARAMASMARVSASALKTNGMMVGVYPMPRLLLFLLIGLPTLACAQAPLHDVLVPYLERHRLPALAAAVVVRGKTVAAGAVGTRQAGYVMPVTLQDRFHLGECTQPITARVAATLVEQRRLLWSSTVAEAFGELAGDMTPPLRGVTLEQLLSHRSGLPVDNEILANLVRRARLEP